MPNERPVQRRQRARQLVNVDVVLSNRRFGKDIDTHVASTAEISYGDAFLATFDHISQAQFALDEMQHRYEQFNVHQTRNAAKCARVAQEELMKAAHQCNNLAAALVAHLATSQRPEEPTTSGSDLVARIKAAA